MGTRDTYSKVITIVGLGTIVSFLQKSVTVDGDLPPPTKWGVNVGLRMYLFPTLSRKSLSNQILLVINKVNLQLTEMKRTSLK